MGRCTRATLVVLLTAIGTAGHVSAQPAGERKATTPAGSGTVTVLAAASLTTAFQAIASAFETGHGHGNVKVQLILGGSSALVQQIQEGAPADVFASADEANMQKLAAAGALASPAQLFARNQLQIVVPAGNPKHITGLADLTRPGLTIALCGPTLPCGHYTAEAFGRAGLSVPPASQELDVKAVLGKVSMNEADAGIVYVTDVRAAGRTAQGVEIPESANVIARYPIAVLKNAPNATAAGAFVDFVLSTEGQRLLAGFGFLPR